MAKRKGEDCVVSRRALLRGMRCAPVLFLPAPVHASALRSIFTDHSGAHDASLPFAESRLTPHYPAKSPLDDALRLVAPGTDQYLSEKYAFEIRLLLDEWSQGLRAAAPALDILAKFLDPSIEATSLASPEEKTLRSEHGIEIRRR